MKDHNQLPHSASPEATDEPTRSVIPYQALTEEIWEDVLTIYFKNAFDGKRHPSEDDFLMLPLENAGRGYRIGSKYSIHSKLELVTSRDEHTHTLMVKFDFYPNESLSEKEAREASVTQAAFRTEVDEYLMATGRAIPEF